MQANTQIDLGVFTYLIVDDDKFSRTLIRKTLGQFGVRKVLETDSAIGALKILKDPEKRVDILLLDQIMPGITGIELARLIRRGEEGITRTNIPIIMVTGVTDKEVVMDAKRVGVQEYIVKPISPATMQQRLTKAIQACRRK